MNQKSRKSGYVYRIVLPIVILMAFAHIPLAEERKPFFNAITVNSAITPPVADYILKHIDEAAKNGAEGLIILLDTPGGLDLAMRNIAKSILNAPLPVIVFVYPSGARAASAGVIITISANIAAMAPGTNIGAAHPVAIGIGGGADKTMQEKIENDAVAYVRGIAAKRGRNADWVEQAVRKSVSITAEEALKKNVIDYVAIDIPGLLQKMEGKAVLVAPGDKEVMLRTKDAVVHKIEMTTREKILTILSDPNIAYILLLVGLAGLYFELTNPGALFPGIIGGICLILAFFSMQTLPVNYAGILLILFGIILFIAEIKVVSNGLLTISGIICLTLGSLMLFPSPDPALRVSLGVLIPAIATISVFFAVVVSLVVKAQMKKRYSGEEAMLDEEGVAITDVQDDGRVFIKGEYWQASSEQRIEKGKRIKVRAIEGFKLKVEEL